ncbi:hypothetical protein RAM_29735 [Amycolatopsis mediterranei S699]|uniref:Uncharacterized protein n=1 Tax=Amycolatopsis mediterranei (strain S699) TaxID=713604 RepID=A0A9R0P1G9_AMYMS|nr:hypothetical protein RAM_29735 [Amycolatopsis mediterranei S699]
MTDLHVIKLSSLYTRGWSRAVRQLDDLLAVVSGHAGPVLRTAASGIE